MGAGAGEQSCRRSGQLDPAGCGDRTAHVAAGGCKREPRPRICSCGRLQSRPPPPIAAWAGREAGTPELGGMLWPCGSLRPREAYRHWRWRTEAVTPELQAVTESRIGPRRSVLPPGDGERPRGPGGGSGTRSCGGRRLPPVFVQLESPPPPRVTRLAPAKTGGEGERGGLRVAKSWWVVASKLGVGGTDCWGSLGVSLRADLTGNGFLLPALPASPPASDARVVASPVVSGRWTV